MHERLAAFYEEEFGKKLAEPESEEDVKNILSCISFRNGYIGNETETDLQGTPVRLNRRFRLLASEAREEKARFTKSVSEQLYKTPFHFFFELIQNADDANYSQARRSNDIPHISFHVRTKEMIVRVNEDGFTLKDVIAICSTGQSSKIQNAETTGEKGFGFKAVFGVASTVHIQSGLWSFTFNHQQHEDGIGMISPIWRQATKLPAGVRTQIILVFASPTKDFLENLCTQLESQPETIVGFLRNIKSLRIAFENVCERRYERRFDLQPIEKPGFQRITSTIDSVQKMHFFLTFSKVVQEMPECETRDGRTSRLDIWWPVTDFETCFPKIDARGQHISAYLPVCQIPQLPFLIQGDFILPASREVVSDNPWNRRLRDQVATLFAKAVMLTSVTKDFHVLRYQWLRFLPMMPIAEIWEPLLELIRKELSGLKTFLSRNNTRLHVRDLRSLPDEFLHDGHPLLQEPAKYSFLSDKYSKSSHNALRYLGIQQLSSQEMLELVIQDSLLDSPSRLHETPLADRWHDSLARLLLVLLREKRTNFGRVILDSLRTARILPIRSGQSLEWRKYHGLSSAVYFPLLVEESHGPERIEIMMPTDLGLVVLHPDASRDTLRKEVYRLLGVSECLPAKVCKAIEEAQSLGGIKQGSDLLSHFELLFWFSHNMLGSKLVAQRTGGGCVPSNQLFLHSDNQYHAAHLLTLHDGQKYQEHFLDRVYQDSPVAARTRGRLTWEQWLCQVAGARWYPPLQDPKRPGRLHWMMEAICNDNASMFVPILQAHWAIEYAKTCRSDTKIKQALRTATVLCRHGEKVQLQHTWLPTQDVLSAASRYDVQSQLPILTLPDSADGCDTTSWSCLRDLAIPSHINLTFYLQVLTALVKSPNHLALDIYRVSEVYMHIGKLATLTDQEELQKLFSEKKMIWDPQNSLWRSSNDCVWDSKIALQQKFVITKSYEKELLKNLFKVLLCIGDTTMEILVDELVGLRDPKTPFLTPANDITGRAAQIYDRLEHMAINSEQAENLRATFKNQELIHVSGKWRTSSSCIWHTSVQVGQHIPIAAHYPDLEKFFVQTLGVSTVTDKFMMKELANAASRSDKEMEQIRSLMLLSGPLISTDDLSKFQSSIDKLHKNKFLPCVSSTGEVDFMATSDPFFIIDNSKYGELFKGKLNLLKFSYQELNKLHNLFKLLRIEDRYLTKNVSFEKTEGEATPDISLTQRFQQCAYALSCCAILHQSPLYFNESKRTHDLLREVTAHTSSNLRTKYVVRQNKVLVSVDADKAYLVVKEEPGLLKITVPYNAKERNMCLRSQLPGYLAEVLHVSGTRAEKQIYRIVNEIDLGTDELMKDEEIPQVEWLTRTERPPRVQQPDSGTPPRLLDRGSTSLSVLGARFTSSATINEGEAAIVVASVRSGAGDHRRTWVTIPEAVDHLPDAPVQSGAGKHRRTWATIPEAPNYLQDAPGYQRVLAHILSQAVRFKWRNAPGEHMLNGHDYLADFFSTLSIHGNDFETSSRTTLFGSDDFSDHRLGAAGELFVFQVLKSLTGVGINLDDWQSTIRHFVRAHPAHADTRAWHGQETADITYFDHTTMLESTLTAEVLGDSFPGWLPTWLEGKCDCSGGGPPCSDRLCPLRDTAIEPLEWLFEVKTTTGPCETELFMSSRQYDRMRTLGSVEDHTRGQVYCLVRVYNLLTDRIGIRFYIDPWRFRDNRLQFRAEKWKVTAK